MAKKLAVSAKAARILRKVAKHILAVPERFEMRIVGVKWGSRQNRDTVERLIVDGYTKPACGTTACIAGWVDALNFKHPDFSRSIERAAKLLGLTTDATMPADDWSTPQDERLFFDEDWPEPYSEQYDAAKTPKQKARIAARRIEHFIKTGE